MTSLSDLLGVGGDYNDILGTEIKLMDSDYKLEYHSIPDVVVSKPKIPGKEPRYPLTQPKKHRGKGTIMKLKKDILDSNRKEFIINKWSRSHNKGRFMTIPDPINMVPYENTDFIQSASRFDQHLFNLLLCIVNLARFKGDNGREMIGKMSEFDIKTMDHLEKVTSHMISNNRITFEKDNSGYTYVKIYRHGLEVVFSNIKENKIPMIVNNGRQPMSKTINRYFDKLSEKNELHIKSPRGNRHLDRIHCVPGYIKMKFK